MPSWLCRLKVNMQPPMSTNRPYSKLADVLPHFPSKWGNVINVVYLPPQSGLPKRNTTYRVRNTGIEVNLNCKNSGTHLCSNTLLLRAVRSRDLSFQLLFLKPKKVGYQEMGQSRIPPAIIVEYIHHTKIPKLYKLMISLQNILDKKPFKQGPWR